MQSAVLSSGAFLGIVLLLTVFSKAGSNPLPNRDLEKTEIEQELQDTPEGDERIQLQNFYLMEFLANSDQDLFSQNQILGFSKRGLDLGLSRGFSGSQAAKHLMGLAAANFAGGPGRKRRSLTYLS